MNRSNKEPLYRKVNTRTYDVRHRSGIDYRHYRRVKNFNAKRMVQGVRRGLDYTPLFMFLLSKVGQPWDRVHSEAVLRLDREEPIFWMVALEREKGKGIIRLGEHSYFSGLFVDGNGILQIVAPEIGPEDLEPTCSGWTHTLNGKPFTKKYTGLGISSWPDASGVHEAMRRLQKMLGELE